MAAKRNKAKLKAELLAAIEADLAVALASHEAAMVGATHSEAKAENSKDTRGLEQSYLARGYAERVAQLQTAVAAISQLDVTKRYATVETGALVELVDDRTEVRTTVWLCSHGGGVELTGGVKVITPTSPLGSAILGANPDDEIEVGNGPSARLWLVQAIF